MKSGKQVLIFLSIVLVAFYSGCGSTVTEQGSKDGDTTQDITLSDVIKDAAKDTNTLDTIEDVEETDAKEDIIIYPDGVSEDIVITDSESKDNEVIEDGSLEDAVSDDIISTDIGTDAGTEDTGSKYCNPGDEKPYTCPNGSTVAECICEYKGCQPICDKIGTRSEGWYDCEGNLIRYARCENCKVDCQAWGSKSEGWYSDCDGLINYDMCAPDWKCVEDPASLCKTYCKDPCDCPQDKPLCINGICDNPILVGCNNNNDLCPCGKFCSGNICEEGTAQCIRSCDCQNNQVCVNGTCKTKQTIDCTKEPCPCNQHCVESQFQNICQNGCETNCDCPADNPICINGMCSKIQSPNCGNDNRNCPCMEVCINGSCQKSTDICDSPCDCKDSTKPSCINMICSEIPQDCSTDLECPCEQSCIEGQCKIVNRCLDACDCSGDNEICKDNICVPKLDDFCSSNSDCPCDYMCQNLQCVKAQRCKYSCDCPQNSQPPYICRDNFCQLLGFIDRCSVDNDCPCGNYCDLNQRRCIKGCNDGCDCPSSTPYCVSNQCSQIPISTCKKDSDCKCGEQCVNGKCTNP